MPQKQISQYLFERIQDAGVDCTFGIPGDFVLPLYAAQQKTNLRTVVMTHEPSVGFAADAYGRMKGLGVALVTYGAGGLNMINPTALAYAEESPLLIISGGPETKYRSNRAFLHHCVKSFATQNNVYAEVTAANAIISSVQIAKEKIDHVIDTVLSFSRPGYIELPRDLVGSEIEINDTRKKIINRTSGLPDEQTKKLTNLICEKINEAKHPVILAGVQISRFGLRESLRKIAESLNIPIVTSITGKSAFPESHPNFMGVYFGQFGDNAVREFFENCDCILVLGAVLTEMETAGFTGKFPPEHLILVNNEEITIAGETTHYDSGFPATFQFSAFISELADSIGGGASAGRLRKLILPSVGREKNKKTNGKDDLSVAHIISSVSSVVDENTAIICDTGDCLYAGLSIKTDCFVAPGYYSTMGFGVPASIGVQLADKTKRPIVLVGDGAFQMTGAEISTAVKEGLSPIIVIFNNNSYAMLKFIDIDKTRPYYQLPNWDYVGFAQALGAEGFKAQTCKQFDLAIQKALKSDRPVIIDAQIATDDISPTLKRMTEFFGNKMRAGVKA